MRKTIAKLKKTKSKGNTLVELVIVMSMIALLGGVLINLISTGGNSYKRVSVNYKAENEARLAMSYTTVKIRQNDIQGAISVLEPPDPNKLIIIKPAPLPGRWEIYESTNAEGIKILVEDDFDGTANPPKQSVIAENIEFYVDMTVVDMQNRIHVTITYLNAERVLEETITLRTDT